MSDLNTLSKDQLLNALGEQTAKLAKQTREVAKRDDAIKQLEAQIEELKNDYLKLWQERFSAKSERYIDACQNQPDCGIAAAARPTGIVEGDKYDTLVATEILVTKFAYHLPVYRQQDMFAGTGWTPSRRTMLNILTRCSFIIEPLLAYFKQVVLTDSIVACDDTGITLLYPKVPPDFDMSDPKQKWIAESYAEALENETPSIKAKMWAYRGQTIKFNVFDFTVSRHRDGP